jgi:haloacetate dehalogenase
MFEGFTTTEIPVSAATLHVRHGGAGPPVLLLHGHPRTHATWSRVAPILARTHTVVCPDLRGFGRSSAPRDTPDHRESAKRAKAQDCLELMWALGHERFAIVGHDRGSYVAFRAAMDAPDRISHLVVLDGVPILEALERCTDRFATRWWHWFFYAQPGKPEQAILADPDAWYGATPEVMGEEAFADYQRAIHDPTTVHTMLEDYRAGLGIDRAHDAADRERGRRVQCPTLCVWSKQDDLPFLYGDVLSVWRPWTTYLEGEDLDCGHHMAEEQPETLALVIASFLRRFHEDVAR